MNELKIFENAEFGSIRTIEIKNEQYFVGKDVAEIAILKKQLETMWIMKIKR